MIKQKLNLILIFVSIFSFSISGFSSDQKNFNPGVINCENSKILPMEISTMLLSDSFYQLNTSLQNAAKDRGEILRIISCSVLYIEKNTYGYIYLQSRQVKATNQPWKAIGSIVSKIDSSANGELILDGMWFEPIAEPPGGATVGN